MRHHVSGAEFICIDTHVSYSEGGTYRLKAGQTATVTFTGNMKQAVTVVNTTDRDRLFTVTHHGEVVKRW